MIRQLARYGLLLACSFSFAASAAVLSGSYAVKNAEPGMPATFQFPMHSRNTYVIHHIGVQICCGGLYTAPTAGASWFDKLDTDYQVSPDSRVQTLDVAALDDDLLYKWWIDNTNPRHPFIADPAKALLKQMNAGDSWPEVLVVDCTGQLKFHAEQEMDEALYIKTRMAIEDTLQTVCPL